MYLIKICIFRCYRAMFIFFLKLTSFRHTSSVYNSIFFIICVFSLYVKVYYPSKVSVFCKRSKKWQTSKTSDQNDGEPTCIEAVSYWKGHGIILLLPSDTSTTVSVCEKEYFIQISTLITQAVNKINAFGHQLVPVWTPVPGVCPHVALNMSKRNKLKRSFQFRICKP